MERSPFSIADDLRRLGLVSGATVMVHTSMRKVGPVEGGAAALCDAIGEVVGPDGTVVMILGALQQFDWVNDHPPHERAELLAPAPPFDAWSTPAEPDVGIVPEVFRTLPGVVVNDHPDGRFAARGRHADALVADGPWDDYYGPGSLLERFVDLDGVVLRLGADDNTVTVAHYAEALADLSFAKQTVTRHHKIARDGGAAIVEVTTIDDSAGICEYDLSGYDPADFPSHAIDDDDGVLDEFAVILADFRRTGAVRTGTVGDARAELLDAPTLVAFAVAWIEAHAIAPGS